MNYKQRKKERNIKKILINIWKFFKTKKIILDFSSQITIIWFIIIICSIFLPWLYTYIWDKWTSWNAFSNIWWNIWYLIFLPIIFLLFMILSSNTKERLKLASNINVKNHVIIIFFGIHCILTSVIYISFIKWLNIFFKNIKFWNWIILFLLWWIVILIWWLINRKSYYKNDYYSYINEDNQNSKNINDESNMKLPF